MLRRFRHGRFRHFAAAAAVLALAACGSSNSSSSTPSTNTSSGPVTITFWTWLGTPQMQQLAAEFTRSHPNIKVNVVNAGVSAAEYTKLETADKAGKGGPDVAQIEYFALPQFALSSQAVNLDGYGAQSVQPRYAASAWAAVTINGGVYGFPQDTGPMAMFYRADIFRKAGLTPPATWSQFAADAAVIHKKFPKTYIANMDPSDPGTATSLMWQAGATPFKIKNTSNVSLNLSQSGVQQWSALWSGLLARKLVATDTGWTTSWWSAMSAGKYATWVTGAWAPAPLGSNIPQTAADWRVAPMPQWAAVKGAGEAGGVTAENGGSSDAVMATSQHKAQAVEFAEWLNSSPEAAQALASLGLFPATSALLTSSSWLNAPVKMLAGQQGNKVLAQSSGQVAAGWQYLPFQVYANSVYADTVGQSISTGTNLSTGLSAWQQRIASYGQSEGFTVKTGS
ncbi:MAG: sugar ABC transporter substrate-binding protein [Streptosporangiaceae bacterium]|nr:sugar ABC transporter substrate-binding protein [Streptosporangiaceae bacterium]MBV9856298.1 sugar ABC transporter substrate-binding protein [Streptosporangiaceae bacterium]